MPLSTRTDTRGVNLNRVYGNPSLTLHPTIYAARKLILYAHLGKDVETEEGPTTAAFTDPPLRPPSPVPKAEPAPPLDALDARTTILSSTPLPSSTTSSSSLFFGQVPSDKDPFKSHSVWEIPSRVRPSRPSASSRSSNASSRGSSLSGFPSIGISPLKHECSSQWYEMTENSRCSEGDESIADFSIPADQGTGPHGRSSSLPHTEEVDSYDFLPPNAVGALSSAARLSQAAMGSHTQRTSFLGAFRGGSVERAIPSSQPRLPETFFQPASLKELSDESGVALSVAIDEDITSASDMMNQSRTDVGPTFPTEDGESGLFMYIDIHGHASKRGIFMYGNHFANPETKMSSLLFPKLMSINCANFDFPACNFTEESQIITIIIIFFFSSKITSGCTVYR